MQLVTVTCVAFLVLNGLVSACPSNLDYDSFYDLEETIKNYADPSVSTTHVPFSGQGCSTRGVLKINLGTSDRVLVDLFFQQPSGWAFNLGGSPTNNGYGGDSRSTVYDGEIHSLGSPVNCSLALNGYKPDVAGSGQAFSYGAFFSTRLTMIVGHDNLILLPDNHNNFNYYNKDLFKTLNNKSLYLGLNRVIYGTSRLGTGLCKVGIRRLNPL